MLSLPEDPLLGLVKIILNGREERNIEYKGSMSWKERDVRMWIIRSILGMANLQDGGFIVLGVKQQGNNFIPSGMQVDHFMSFNQDKVDDVVKNYPDPFVEVKVAEVHYVVVKEFSEHFPGAKVAEVPEGDAFIVLQVMEFEELPVICKKDGKLENGKLFLQEGKMYTRSRNKIETVEVRTQTEMREIIELAADKSLHKFVNRMGRAGIMDLIKSEPS